MKILTTVGNFFAGDPLKEYNRVVETINSEELALGKVSAEELKEKSENLKKELSSGKVSENDILPTAFALIREAAKRTLDQRHYDVQLIGGMVLHDGKVAEMLTGEGKTLASTCPIYLNALMGKGVHVVTVNDYLAKRDTVWMSQIYHVLGLSVGCLVHDESFIYDPEYTAGENVDEQRDALGSFKIFEEFLRPVSRQEAYKADITYGTNHQFGFDFLRDNILLDLSQRVQRGHNFAVIDEVDSVLIDEARTPLIISSPDTQSSEYFRRFSQVVRRLEPNRDYEVDEKNRSVDLTDEGVERVEHIIGVDNIYSPENSNLVHYLNESLKAKELYLKDKNYVVKNNEIILVDEFTGRLMPGRRLSAGLHEAIEAKESLPIKQGSKTVAQITIQNYFRLYKKISGMTGTAQTSAEEFDSVYGMDTVSIPPNKPVVRGDKSDLVYKTKEGKIKAVVEEVKKVNELGQPILLGTTSIANNEELSVRLKQAGVRHEVLNAKDNQREGEIIAQAGRLGAVTVATNMAGRGIDIVLGGNPPDKDNAQKVKEVGGLYVIGTERHESRRIDDQLRGRSGRQGDPGLSRFFLSLEDDLMRIFGGERIQSLMETLRVSEDIPIESNMVSKVVNQAQAKVEGMNLDMRKHLIDFDDVLNRQRTAVYERREKFIKAGENGEIMEIVSKLIKEFGDEAIKSLEDELNEISRREGEEGEIERRKNAIKEIERRIESLPEKVEPERAIIIAQQLTRMLDMLWMENLSSLQDLRESVGIRAYGQKEPLVEYRREASFLYKELNKKLKVIAFNSVFRLLEADIEMIKRGMESQEKETELQAKHSHKKTFAGKPGVVSKDVGKKVGRNDPCPCGAKKPDGTPIKYKHCHGA